jgi:predicted hydrocarbon binding protein
LFYELNEGSLEKEAEVWFYKEGKDIVGPVSSYNMDKLVYYRKIEEETRVAFQSVDKFVKFAKIQKIVEAERKNE